MHEIVETNFLDIEENKKIKEFVESVVSKCFEIENLNNLNFYLSITLTSSEQIHKLNKKYRNVDKETDVLSFPMFEKEELNQIINNKVGNKIPEAIGDIVICVQKVEEQAKEYGHSFERELAYMVVHGFYHIMGYDHIKEEDKVKMRPKEEKVLQELKQGR